MANTHGVCHRGGARAGIPKGAVVIGAQLRGGCRSRGRRARRLDAPHGRLNLLQRFLGAWPNHQ